MQKKKVIKKWSNQVILNESAVYIEMWNVVIGFIFALFSMCILSLICLDTIIKDIPTSKYLLSLIIKWPLSFFGFFEDDMQVFYNSINIYKFTLVIFISLTSGLLAGLYFYRPIHNTKVLKGKELFDDSDAVELFKKELEDEVLDSDLTPTIKLIDEQYISEERRTTHILISGSTGAGKSVTLKPIIAQLFAKNYKSLILDIKGDFVELFYNPKKQIGLFGIDDIRSFVWDIKNEITTEDDVSNLSNDIIRIGTNDGNAFFASSAREVLRGILFMLIFKWNNEKIKWNCCDLLNLCSMDFLELANIANEYNPAVKKVLADENVTSLGVVMNMDTFLTPIKSLAKMELVLGENNLFTFEEWIRNENPKYKQILWTVNQERVDFKIIYSIFFNLITNKIISSSLSDDNKRKIFLIFDELPQIKKISIQAIVELSRSKGVTFVAGIQSFSQLVEIYGKQIADLLFSNIKTHIYGYMGAGPATEELSNVVGKQVVSTFNVSGNSSTEVKNLSTNEKHKEIVNSSYFSNRLGKLVIEKKRFSFKKLKMVVVSKKTYFRMLVSLPNGIYNIPFPLEATSKIKKINKPSSHYFSNYKNITTKELYQTSAETFKKYPLLMNKTIINEDEANKENLKKNNVLISENDISRVFVFLEKGSESEINILCKYLEKSTGLPIISKANIYENINIVKGFILNFLNEEQLKQAQKAKDELGLYQ